MMKLRTTFGACVLVFAVTILAASAKAAPATCGAHGDSSTMLVSTGWLADHLLHDPNVVIFSVGMGGDYEKGHIPGALLLPNDSVFTESNGLTMELQPMPELKQVFQRLGVTNDSHIVLYYAEAHMVASAARVYMTLDAMGLGAHASLLDGGYELWQSEGRPVTTDVRAITTGTLDICPRSDVVVEVNYVKSNLNHAGVHIVDARLPQYYTGAEKPDGQRLGHIPGASNIPYASLVEDNGKLKAPAELQSLFHAAAIKPGDRVVSYCHIGQQASLLYFVARYLGYDARLYDGSWQDWSRHADFPAEKSR
jgi:thiosulfate/3-mercaptopyruvate sulfurtransferase